MPDPIETPAVAYLIGSPRSGTTWVQHALGCHPEVVSPQETGLFESYLSTWEWHWNDQLPEDEGVWQSQRYRGLPAVLTTEEFYDLIRLVADRVYRRVLGLKPGATLVVDKDPGNALLWRLIARTVPRAGFIHVIRDGRDVAASMLRASQGWGAGWAPASVHDGAHMWGEHVAAGRDCTTHTPSMEIRYEALLADPADAISRCLEFLGLERSDRTVADMVQRSSLGSVKTEHGLAAGGISWGGEVARRRGLSVAEPGGFFGESTAGAWRKWSRAEREEFNQMSGRLLISLGYEPDARWVEG